MIRITRFNGSHFYLNAELIQTVEGAPDTVITLTNNVKIVVKESPEQVVESILHYRQKIHDAWLVASGSASTGSERLDSASAGSERLVERTMPAVQTTAAQTSAGQTPAVQRRSGA